MNQRFISIVDLTITSNGIVGPFCLSARGSKNMRSQVKRPFGFTQASNHDLLMSISHTLSHPTLPNKPATYPQEILSSSIVLVKKNQGV